MARHGAGATTERPGRFGAFGGQFVPPALLPVLDRLEQAFEAAWRDDGFRRSLDDLTHRFVGRPTPLFEATRLLAAGDGARLVLKRDDLCPGGAAATPALGQCLLARRMGLSRVVTDTGSGENGLAVAAVAAQLGLSCTVFMGARDAERQRAAVKKMRAFGAELRLAEETGANLHAAMSAALRHWMGDASGTAYIAGAPIGPHPFPAIVAAFQEVIGRETRRQLASFAGLPAAVVATVGGGGAALGLFSAFVGEAAVHLVAVEAAGSGQAGAGHAARLTEGRRGVLHGAETLVLSDDDGLTREAASIAPGLAYPGAAPQLAHLAAIGRLETVTVSDHDARATVAKFAACEGILVSLEAGHALAAAETIAHRLPPAAVVAVMIASAGDKDLDIIWDA